MPSTMCTATLRAAAVLAVLAAPLAAGAQERPQSLQTVRVSADEAAARAGELHTRALHTGSDLSKLGKAARLHEQSAGLREASDPQAFECLREAALLRYYDGDRRAAVGIMERAARLAVSRGDVINASRSFSDAAIIAHELRQGVRAWDLGLHAETLTSSPLLTDAQREYLRMRNVQLDRQTTRLAVNAPIGAP
jgi:hypothetical protein